MKIIVSSMFALEGVKNTGEQYSFEPYKDCKVTVFGITPKYRLDSYINSMIEGKSTMNTFIPNSNYVPSFSMCKDSILKKFKQISEIGSIIEIESKFDIEKIKDIHTSRHGNRFSLIQYEYDELLNFSEENDRKIISSFLLFHKDIYKKYKVLSCLSASDGDGTITLIQLKSWAEGNIIHHVSDNLSENIEEILSSKIFTFVDFDELITSMEDERANSNRFLSAWIVLEKFISKYYKSIEPKKINYTIDKISSYLNDNTQEHVSNGTLEIDKLPIQDKFAITLYLKNESISNEEINSFVEIKKSRNLVHKGFKSNTHTSLDVLKILFKYF